VTTESNELVLRPRRKKWILLVFVCAGFVAAGFSMVKTAAAPTDRLMGWSAIAFFGCGMIVGVLQLVPRASYLRISADGLLVRSLWRNTLYRWSDIDEFGVAEFSTVHHGLKQRHRMVGFNFSRSYLARHKTARLKRLNRQLVGFDTALPDNYSYDCAELAQSLNTAKARFAAISGTTQAD
jgi:hypothetical protein